MMGRQMHIDDAIATLADYVDGKPGIATWAEDDAVEAITQHARVLRLLPVDKLAPEARDKICASLRCDMWVLRKILARSRSVRRAKAAAV